VVATARNPQSVEVQFGVNPNLLALSTDFAAAAE
jgi:hypothetical protein